MAIVAAPVASVATPRDSSTFRAPRSAFVGSSSFPQRPPLGRPVRANVARSGFTYSSTYHVRAASSTDEAPTTSSTGSIQTDEIIEDLKAKWDSIEDKTIVLIYGGGALVALWVSATIVGAVNSVPLLPKVLELVGLAYAGWFVYRYLLFKDNRKELVRDVEELKSKISGGGKK